MKFSIVIPVYNAENKIADTITRISEIDHEDYECIFVNDGSTDKTLDVLEKSKNKIANMKIITTENRGPGPARNVGIEEAEGRFLLFFDADDHPKASILSDYEKLFEGNENIDLIISSFLFRELAKGEIISERVYQTEDRIYSSRETFLNDMYELMNQQLMYVVWNKCYLRKTIIKNGIRFKPYRSCEDRIFNLEYYQYCNRVLLNPKVEYVYEFISGEGITNKYSSEKFDTFKEFYEMTNKVTDSVNDDGTASLFLKGTTSTILSIVNSDLSSLEKRKKTKTVFRDPDVRTAAKIARTDSLTKKVTRLLFSLPFPLFYSVLIAGGFVEKRLPGVMNFVKRKY